MAQDKYYYQQLPLTKNMQTSDTFTGERKCISIPNHKRKIKNIWKLGAAKEGLNESEFALKSISNFCLEKGYVTTKQLVEMM